MASTNSRFGQPSQHQSAHPVHPHGQHATHPQHVQHVHHQQNQHHSSRVPHQRPPMMQQQRAHNAVANSAMVSQASLVHNQNSVQSVQNVHNVGHSMPSGVAHSMSHNQTGVHMPSNMSYQFVMPSMQSNVIAPHIVTQQHIPQHYQTQSRMHHPQHMGQYYQVPIGVPGQQYAQPSQYYVAYPPHAYHTAQQHNPQVATQVMSQIHAQRGTQMSQQVIPQQVVHMGSIGANNEINESNIRMQQKQSGPQRRQKTIARITDPSSGRDVDIAELANANKTNSESLPSSYESSGSSSVNNASITSTPKPKDSEDMGIALEFMTDVTKAAIGPINNCNEAADTPASAVANVTHSECGERTDIVSDNSESNATDSCVTLTNSNVCAVNDIYNDKTVSNIESAQQLVENNSQISVNSTASHDVLQNGSASQLVNQSQIDSAKEHSVQKNSKRKDSKKSDNKLSNDELEEAIISESNVNESTNVSDTSIPSASVMISSQTTEEDDDVTINEKLCNSNNNLSESQVEKKNAENMRLILNDKRDNDLGKEDILNNDDSIAKLNANSTILPDLPYKDDQWSPMNPEGKKYYDRDFLIAVQEKYAANSPMPQNLQFVTDIIRKAHTDAPHNKDPFLPSFANASDRRSLHQPNVSRRQSQPGRGQPEKNRKIISTSLTHDVKLHTTENAWKPSKLAAEPVDPDEQETLDLLKKIRGILNKLTPQKYDALLNQIMTFKVDTEDRLKRVLDLVFEKAVDEPAFCLQYANLCKHIAQFKVTVMSDGKEEEVKFQKLLLTKCQKEFEMDVYAVIENFKERQQEIEECQDREKRKILAELLDEDMRRARKRSLGNIKLIGELYKLHMLRGTIMLQCIDKLCNLNRDDESLECLCALLRTIGEQIEEEAANQKSSATAVLDSFFDIMEKIANQRIPDLKTSPRVRFMLQDTIEMRKNNWKPRREENAPKMIDEIHQEVKKEEELKQQELQQHSMQKRQEERDKRKGKQSDDKDVWVTAGRKSQSQQQTHQTHQTIDWNAMKSSMNQGQVSLGPQTGAWGHGSRGGSSALNQPKSSSISEDRHTNRFSALDSSTSDRKSHKPNSVPSRDSSKGRSNQQIYQSQGGNRRPPSQRDDRERDRDHALKLAQQFSSKPPSDSSQYSHAIFKSSSRNGSREHSAPNSRNSSMRRDTPDSEQSVKSHVKEELSEQELQSRFNNLMKEYLSNKDVTEAVYEVKTKFSDNNIHIYISFAINYALEISSQSDHNAIGNLLCHLVVKQNVTFDQFFKGLYSILESADDIAIDVPKFWDYIGEILAPILIELPDNKRREFLIKAAQPCSADNPTKLVAKIFAAIVKLTSETQASLIWQNSNLIDDFSMPGEFIKSFANENQVENLLVGPTNSSYSDANLRRFSEELQNLVKQNKSNDEIQDFISKYFNAKETSTPRFTCALFSGAIRGCLIAPQKGEKDFYTLSSDLLESISPLLCKFLGGNPELELQALIILQKLMEELQHPPGLLNSLFESLYNHSVISQEAFLQWESSDASESGKGVAITSVARFLTWLRENEEDEEEEYEGDEENMS